MEVETLPRAVDMTQPQNSAKIHGPILTRFMDRSNEPTQKFMRLLPTETRRTGMALA